MTAARDLEEVRQGLAMALEAHGMTGCAGHVAFDQQGGRFGVDGLYIGCRHCGHFALALS